MKTFLVLGTVLLAALPATNNYRLNSYGFGSGGTTNSSTSTYALEGTVGEISGSTGSTTNNSIKPGFIETQQANVPKLVSLDNNGGQYYNKLRFIIDTQSNPPDALYLLAVSTDNFATNIRYIQPDGTLSPTLSTAQYQTYTAWGGAAGSFVVGLLPSTTYSVKLKATQGKFSESAFGPTTFQATAAPSLTFSLNTTSSPSPPYTIDLGTLNADIVNTTSGTINTTVSTNGTTGADVYITSKNGGLLSSSTGNKINAASSDLNSVGSGFGGQNSTVSQTSGGPYNVLSPYNTTGNSVGIINAITRSLYSSTAPITNGTGSLRLKAKSASIDVAATDYRETITFIAAGNF